MESSSQSIYRRCVRVLTLAAGLWAAGFASGVARADKPSEIRMAYPGVGVGNRPFVSGSSVAVMHLQGLLEEEFRKDGIKVTWTFARGAGPAVNEMYANNLADFSLLGDLPSIVARASGVKTRMLAATSIRQNTYLAVPADSSIQSIKDLKGKRVALFKGTNLQLVVSKILEANGLSEKDIRAINMDTATARAALITKDIDASFGDNQFLALRDQGAVRIIYNTVGDPHFARHCSFVGSDDFIRKYPDVTLRVVKTLVTAAKWISEREAAPQQVFQLWTKSGIPFGNIKEDYRGQSLKLLSSPLIDAYITDQYQHQIAAAKKYALIRETFDFTPWVDTSFLNRALKDLGLEHYWDPVDVSGKPVHVAASAAASATTATASLP